MVLGMTGILVANRGEIAIRVLRAARALGIRTIAVYARDDSTSLHVRRADEAHPLPGDGPAAYLDAAAMLDIATATGATAIHPGYGFLSENADFARLCADKNITFIGPSPELLALFGDKVRARELAAEVGVPVLPGTSGATDVSTAREFATEHGAVMVKALAGGGGRGMRAVTEIAELDEAYERCRSEATQAFGSGDLYVEKLVPHANHIEVQVVGDGVRVAHLWERDCGIQRRHQKIVEVAPSPSLRPELRDRILAAALTMAGWVDYTSLGTFEFLVSGDEFWFIEANPRLQVEHTVTEEITGVDLVQAQIRIANGATLTDVGLAEPPTPVGFAIQARVNSETLRADGTVRPHSGTLRAFTPPSGPGVRVDTHAYTGYAVNQRYDSLLAKVIARGRDFPAASARCAEALDECQVDGLITNIPLLRKIVADSDFRDGNWDTSFVSRFAEDEQVGPVDLTVVVAPLAGTVIDISVGEGERVAAGARLLVLEAMKMEHVVTAARGGLITGIVPGKGDMVDEDSPLVFLDADDSTILGVDTRNTDGQPAAGVSTTRAVDTRGVGERPTDSESTVRGVDTRGANEPTRGVSTAQRVDTQGVETHGGGEQTSDSESTAPGVDTRGALGQPTAGVSTPQGVDTRGIDERATDSVSTVGGVDSRGTDEQPAGRVSTDPEVDSRGSDAQPAGGESAARGVDTRGVDEQPAGGVSSSRGVDSRGGDEQPAGGVSTARGVDSRGGDQQPAGGVLSSRGVDSRGGDGEPVGGVSAASGGDSGSADRGWADEVAEIARRRELALLMGGDDKIARHHREGRLTARERIDLLIDPGTFAEIGPLTGFGDYAPDGTLTSILPANFVTGTALLNGRKVIIGVDDFTVRGGSGDAAIHAKQIFSEQFANQMRLPVIRLLDGQSGGGSVKMAQEHGFTYVPVNPAWDVVVDNLSVVPVVAASLGPTVGLGAGRLVMSHLAVMVTGVGQLFVAGPPVVRGATGEDLTKEQLGGAAVHRRNGAVERFVPTEQDAFDVIRTFLSYLPRSVYEIPPIKEQTEFGPEYDLLSAIPRNPRQPYRIDPILAAIFDADSVFRYADYGGGTVTALARLDGHPVGVIATDPFKGATMSDVGAQAITRLVDLCETFHLPLVSLTDQAGMTIGLAGEQRGTIRHGARAISAIYQTRVPQAELILRRVYGVGGAGIVNRHRAVRSWAWPSGDWGSLPMQGGVEAAFRAQLDRAEDKAAELERLRALLAAITSPFRTAERFGVQDLIDPRDSRALLCDWVVDAYRLLPDQVGRPSFGARP